MWPSAGHASGHDHVVTELNGTIAAGQAAAWEGLMLKHGRGSSGYGTNAAFTLSPMQQVTQALAGGRGGTILALATHESRATGLHPPTVPAVQGVLQQLSQQEEQIVRMRYGIGEHMHSVDEISRRLGIMPRQVERIRVARLSETARDLGGPERSDRPATPPAPLGRGGRPPLLPSEPQPLPDDFDSKQIPGTRSELQLSWIIVWREDSSRSRARE